MTLVFGRKATISLVLIFVILFIVLLVFKYTMEGSRIDFNVLLWANGLMFVLGLISLRMNLKALIHQNVQVFLRLMYGSFILKFFVLALAAFIYIFYNKENLSKPALFGCFGLYLIYTFIELRFVMKQSKKPNA